MAIKSVLKPENSIVAGLATVGLVYGIYQLNTGPVADVHASGAYDGNIGASLKKAGWEAIVLTAGVALLARDVNIVILGGATVIAMELSYRHAHMSHPDTGQVVAPPVQAYQPVGGGNVVSGNFAMSQAYSG